MDGEGKKFKLPTIETKDKRKFIKIKGKRLFLDSLLKKINKKRKQEKKRPLKSITKRNLKTALAEILFKKDDKKPKKLEFSKIKKPRRRRVPRIGKTKDPVKAEQQSKEIDALKKQVSDLKTQNEIQIVKNKIDDIKSRSILRQQLLENKIDDLKQDKDIEIIDDKLDEFGNFIGFKEEPLAPVEKEILEQVKKEKKTMPEEFMEFAMKGQVEPEVSEIIPTSEEDWKKEMDLLKGLTTETKGEGLKEDMKELKNLEAEKDRWENELEIAIRLVEGNTGRSRQGYEEKKQRMLERLRPIWRRISLLKRRIDEFHRAKTPPPQNVGS